MHTAVLVDGCRTPFLKAGTVQGNTATEMGVAVVKALMARYPHLDDDIDAVIGANVGNQLLPRDGSNISRIIAVQAGLPRSIPASTINMNCVSSMEAVAQATRMIACGQADLVLVPAVEVMGDYTLLLGKKQRARYERMVAASHMKKWWKKVPAVLAAQAGIWAHGHKPLLSANFGDTPLWMLQTGLTDPLCGLGMDQTAEAVARKWHITREEQDLFALDSHHRASAAQKAERFAKEIIPFRGQTEDNGIRHGQEMMALAKLRPLTSNDTVTAGNSSQITDGAVALFIASEEFARACGLPVLATLSPEAMLSVGCAPEHMGIGPTYAAEKLLTRMELRMSNCAVIESNEAFAAVVLAQDRILAKTTVGGFFPTIDMPKNRLNVNGGAIALGHPIAATGARLILTAALELALRNGEFALVTACVGGGQGYAILLRRS